MHPQGPLEEPVLYIGVVKHKTQSFSHVYMEVHMVHSLFVSLISTDLQNIAWYHSVPTTHWQ